MRQPRSVKALEDLGRIRLSENFFLRDFLYSDIAVINGFANIPDDPDLAIDWQLADAPVLSDKDAKLPAFRDLPADLFHAGHP